MDNLRSIQKSARDAHLKSNYQVAITPKVTAYAQPNVRPQSHRRPNSSMDSAPRKFLGQDSSPGPAVPALNSDYQANSAWPSAVVTLSTVKARNTILSQSVEAQGRKSLVQADKDYKINNTEAHAMESGTVNLKICNNRLN